MTNGQDTPPTGWRRNQHESSLVDELGGEIQLRVMAGTIPVGSWLRQETLAAEFGVSRTPVREALRKLEARGVIELIPRRGALVRGPTARDVREAYQVRAELEGLAAELAAGWIGRDQLTLLREAEDMFQRSATQIIESADGPANPVEDDEVWYRANSLFHEVVQEAAGNERLRGAIGDLHRTFPRNLTWTPLRENVRLLEENIDQHRRIRKAIESGEAELARREMQHHVRRAGELVAEWFDRQTQGSRTASPG